MAPQPLKHLVPQKVAGVTDEQAAQALGQRFRMSAVVIAPWAETQVHQVSARVAGAVQLEAVKPAPACLPARGKARRDLVRSYVPVLAHAQRGRIHEENPRLAVRMAAEPKKVAKQRHGERSSSPSGSSRSSAGRGSRI